jgi:acetate kinase
LAVLGHRVAYGGEAFNLPPLVDDFLVQAIREVIPLAPLHNSANPSSNRKEGTVSDSVNRVKKLGIPTNEEWDTVLEGLRTATEAA